MRLQHNLCIICLSRYHIQFFVKQIKILPYKLNSKYCFKRSGSSRKYMNNCQCLSIKQFLLFTNFSKLFKCVSDPTTTYDENEVFGIFCLKLLKELPLQVCTPTYLTPCIISSHIEIRYGVWQKLESFIIRYVDVLSPAYSSNVIPTINITINQTKTINQ